MRIQDSGFRIQESKNDKFLLISSLTSESRIPPPVLQGKTHG
mgnify:CR=1 FL=1